MITSFKLRPHRQLFFEKKKEEKNDYLLMRSCKSVVAVVKDY
jgi:hypothetical protein